MRQALAGIIGTTFLLTSDMTAAEPQRGVMRYVNPSYGFTLTVPTATFRQAPMARPDAGALWVTQDGRARLIAVATPNDTGETLRSYRAFVLERTYTGANIDYAPVRENWFVLSGTKDGQTFYERITFVCNGRYIYGWLMMYPTAEKAIYDAMVERVHNSYKPGRGTDGRCGQ